MTWSAAIRKTAAILLGLLVGIVAYEIAGRLLLGRWVAPPVRLLFQHIAWTFGGSPALLHEDSDLGVRTVPGLRNEEYAFRGGTYHVTTNPLGFNDIGFRSSELAGPPFAVVVGDSHTFCTTVEDSECWVRLLESSTRRTFANLGIPGTGSLSHLRVVERYALALKPRVLLWQFTSNDPLDDLTLVRKQSLSGGGFLALRHWFLYHSLLYNSQIYLRQAITSSLGGGGSLTRVYTNGTLRLSIPENNWATGNIWTDDYLAGWTYTQRSLLDAKNAADQVGVRLVVVAIPYREEVHRTAVNALFPKASLISPDERPAARLTQFLAAHGISVLDATAELERHAERDEQLYQPEDAHLTPLGNRVLAAILEQYLRSKQLVDEQ